MQTIETLIRLKDEVLDELKKSDPKNVARLIIIEEWISEFHSRNTAPKESAPLIVRSTTKKQSPQPQLTPIQMGKKIFRESPGQRFSPPELRDELKKRIDAGEVEFKGKSLLTSTHTIIRMLLKKDFIERIKDHPNDDPVYQFKKDGKLI